VAVFKNLVAFGAARGVKGLLGEKADTARGGTLVPTSRSLRALSTAGTPSGRTGTRSEKLKRAGRRIARKGRLLGLRARRRLSGGEAAGVDPANVVWIFGAGRTGSTWLSRMMEELEGHTVWIEPWVGALFDPYHLRLEDREGENFILAPEYKSTWLKPIRSFVLDGASVRFPEVSKDGYLVIKEPGGSAGAPLLMEALPESRMVLLVRDPRDVVASWTDARKKGGWRSADAAPDDPMERVVRRARKYLQNVGEAKKAYDFHVGRKVLVRYEELRADTSGTMRRIYSELGVPVDEGELAQAVKKHAWENIPEEEKGSGKFYRKATPGGWREDLTPKQAKRVEKITAPLLRELYPDNTL
jgi:hypothetical protein